MNRPIRTMSYSERPGRPVSGRARRHEPATPRRPFVRLAVLVVCLAAPASPSLRADWRPFGLQGIGVRTLESVPAILCAGTDGAGVFCMDRRPPRGDWRPAGLAGSTINDLWIDPERPRVMCAAAGNAARAEMLSRTLDGGLTWESIGDRLPGGLALVTRVAGVAGTSTVFAAGGAVWRSDDLGDSWRQVFDLAWQGQLEIAPTDPETVWSGGDLAFAFAPEAFLDVTRDGGATWDVVGVWLFDYTPLTDIAAHPSRDGLVLTGHGGFLQRTEDHGATFRKALEADGYLFSDWSPRDPRGEPASPLGLAVVRSRTTEGAPPLTYVSRDAGESWTQLPGDDQLKLRIFDLETDVRWPGVAWIGTADGVYAFFAAGRPVCHDVTNGINDMFLWDRACPPILAPILAVPGDIIAAELDGVRPAGDRIDLGRVHCLIEYADIAFTTLEPPDPPPGEILVILSRKEGDADYGRSTDGLRRLASSGDCL